MKLTDNKRIYALLALLLIVNLLSTKAVSQHPPDSLALVDFYNALNGDDWLIRGNWLTGPLDTWEGIIVEEGRVIEINLPMNNLIGTLPASLADLTALRFFYIWDNSQVSGNIFDIALEWPLLERISAHDCNLSGPIPPQLFSLPNLIELRMFGNPLIGGAIPNEIGNALSLEMFQLTRCGLEGGLPISITNLTNLQYLELEGNNLTGQIPADIGNLSTLHTLNLGDNQFEGELPSSFYQLTNLLNIQLNDNQFSGVLSESIGDMSSLTNIYISNNNFSGSLPESLGQLSNLWHVNISNNNFSGPLPASLGQLTGLGELYLSNNNFAGEIPQSLTQLESLISFHAYQNSFEGTIPDIIHLPNLINFDVYGNGRLSVPIPDDIGSLTQLQTFAIGGTKPNGGEFPEGFYDLTELRRLDLGGQQFTGNLDERVANWAYLDNLYLWQNRLEGAVPTELAQIEGLRVFDISQNRFTSLPDFSETNLQELIVVGNQLTFNSLIPNLSLPNFVFRNQARIGGDRNFQLSIGENTSIPSSLPEEEEVVYTWTFNGNVIDITDFELQINNFDISQSGSYGISATHPAIEEFTLFGGFINLKMPGAVRSWYVDNKEGAIADFTSFTQAIYASRANDTIFVAGSEVNYFNPGGILITEPLVIIGPGYFLEENTGLQQNTHAATIGNSIVIRENAHGTQLMGLNFAAPVRLNNTFFTEGDTLRNIKIIGNRFDVGSDFGFTSHIDGLEFKRNMSRVFAIYGTDFQGEQSGLFANYKNIVVENNIGLRIRPFNYSISINPERNSLENFVFRNNVIDTIANVSGIVFENNILKPHSASNNTFNNNIDFSENLFVNSSENLNIDNDFFTVDAALPQGPFAGDNPYLLSGIPPIPSIAVAQQQPLLTMRVDARNNSPQQENLRRLRVTLLKGGQVVNEYFTSSIPQESSFSHILYPRLTNLSPGGEYQIMLSVTDTRGIASHRTYVPFTAFANQLSGNVTRANNTAVPGGSVTALRIVPNRVYYDTIASVNIAASGNYTFNNLFHGNYLVLATPNTDLAPRTLPTYYPNTIDWQNALTVIVDQNRTGMNIQVEEVPEPSATPGSQVSGTVEADFDEDAEEGTRYLLNRRAVSGAGASIRVASSTVRNLRDTDDGYELVAYIQTDANGKFNFSNLPAGSYRIRIDIPGVPVVENEEFEFDLRGVQGEETEFLATVTENGITIERIRYLNIASEKAPQLMVYPNPASSRVYLKSSDSTIENLKVEVLDLQGRKMKTVMLVMPHQNDISVSDLTSGMYLLKITHENGELGIVRVVIK